MGSRQTEGPPAALYDRIGDHYTATRRTDPRIAAAIWRALGDARTVLNVGAGAGAYEPLDRDVLAVEPSEAMIAQRPPGSAPVLRASAHALPLPDASLDAVMAILSDHHWHHRRAALRELRRVARKRIVLFNADPSQAERFWMTREYLPGFLRLIPASYRRPGRWATELEDLLGQLRFEAVPIPYDCQDGFYGAFWRRPAAYLEERVRAAISVFSLLPEREVERGIARLREDLSTGAWHERHRDMLELEELDLGYRVVIADVG